VFLLVLAYPGSPGPTAVKRSFVCVCVCVYNSATIRGRKMCDMSNLLSVTLLLDSYLAVTLVKNQS